MENSISGIKQCYEKKWDEQLFAQSKNQNFPIPKAPSSTPTSPQNGQLGSPSTTLKTYYKHIAAGRRKEARAMCASYTNNRILHFTDAGLYEKKLPG